MKHEIDKNNMINDIILTLALVVSIVLTELTMLFTNFVDHEYETAIFLVLIFIFVKLTYNGFNMVLKSAKRIRE